MMVTPIRPTPVAIQRRRPTFSPRKMIDSAVTNSGATNRIHAISIEGNVADRYFAATSEAPRKIVEARINAMPLNGRSARAGALGAADFFSGNGNRALSSLAAAAGGGVTAISEVDNIESGEALKKANWPGT